MGTDFTSKLPAFYRRIERFRGVDITYRRGEHSVGFKAVPTHSKNPVNKVESFRAGSTDREYIVFVESLVLNGERVTPKAGDRIREGNHDYTVADGDGKKCFRPMEPSGSLIRIFTKLDK